MILNDFVSLILNTLFPTIVVSLVAIFVGLFTLWISLKHKSKPIKIQGLAVFALGVAYLFSYFSIGDISLRHALIRFSLVWVILSVAMEQIWRLARDGYK